MLCYEGYIFLVVISVVVAIEIIEVASDVVAMEHVVDRGTCYVADDVVRGGGGHHDLTWVNFWG